MDVNDLESAINSAKDTNEVSSAVDRGSEDIKMSAQEEIGFHKGAINTLRLERAELLKMVGNVEAIAGAHLKRLEELGVDVK